MHLTGPKGNREAEGNIEVEGLQHSLVPVGRVMKCFVVLINSKVKTKKPAKEYMLGANWHNEFAAVSSVDDLITWR